MNDFEKLSAIGEAGRIRVEAPKGQARNIESDLTKSHSLRPMFGQVRFNYDPLFFRSKSIDYLSLITAMSENLGLKFETPEIVKVAMKKDGQVDADLLEKAFNSAEGLQFNHGLVKYDKEGVEKEVILRSVNLHSQNVTVALDGTTNEAEVVAQKIVSELISSQGLSMSWADFKKCVGGTRYLTTTELDLGFNPLSLLSQPFKDFLTKEMEGELGYCMADKPMSGPVLKDDDFSYRCVLSELKLRVSVYNKLSGDQDYCDLRLDVGDRRHLGTGWVAITSFLKYEDHLRALLGMVESGGES